MKRLLLFFAFILCVNFSFSQGWGIVGSATPNGWGGPDIPMTFNVDLDIWEATVEFTDGEVKFRENNDWANNYGDNGIDGSLEAGGANIPVSAGYYSVSLNLNTQTYTLEPFEFLLVRAWKIASEAGALKVGPTEGSDQWWSNDEQTLIDRACYFDDEYVFNLDGSFQNILGEETWLEPWQGGAEPNGQCGAPKAPHNGTVTATYSYDEIAGTITINGQGAYLGLPKATNEGSLTEFTNVPESITYNVVFSENDNVMTLSIEAGSGVFWTYKLISQNVVSIPDTNFEAYLETHTANGDEVLIGDPSSMGDGVMNHLTLKSSVEGVTNLNVNDLGITSLIGIEAFSSLEDLYCQRNQLANLDVTKNSVLSILECESNQFTALDLSQNKVLKTIGCANNNLSELDVSQNLLLEGIWFTNNNITSLNVDANTNLKVYGFSDNPLTSLSIKNGNNKNIVYSTMQNLPSLSCITVDDENADNSNLNLDPAVAISNNCSGSVAIPDPIFEAALIELGLDTDETVNGQISQIDAENIYSLNIVDKGINDVTGIKYFVNLEQLFCNNNNLTELQLNTHTNLNGIWINNNPVTSINLKNCPSLVYLHISQNQLEAIDISSNPLLMELSIANNNLTSLDASNNPNLTFLRANGNDLYSINIENGNNLNFAAPEWWPYSFDVRFNYNLSCIQVDAGLVNNIPSDWAKENNTFYSEDGCNDVVPIPDPNFELALINAGIDTNGETGDVLRVEVHNITYLNLGGKEITDLTGLSAFKNLNHLIIYSNPISEIDLSSNTELEVLQAGANELTSLDISNNQKLRELWAWTNQLESLNTSNNPLLEELWLGQNNITALDLSNNSNLIGLEIHQNPITSIDFSKNLNLERLWAWETNLTGLNLSKNRSLNQLRVQDNLELSYLNVENGNNVNMDNFIVSGTSKLSCITADANVHENMTAFSDGRLNEDCRMVYIIDESFEQALIELEIDTDGIINHLISRVDAENTSAIIANFPLLPDGTTNVGADPRVTITTKIKDLTGLDAFTNLEVLECQGNQLTNLDISKNLALTKLECGWNQISNLDVSQNSTLEILGCHDNNLSSIDVSKNLALKGLWCSNNNITGLNLDVNTNLNLYGVSNNPLTYLSIKNGNNHNVTYSELLNLPNLLCITVDDETASYFTDKYFWKAVTDAGISFSNDCGTVYIPDVNFEQSLVDIGVDTDGLVNQLLSKTDAEAVNSLNLTNPLFDPSSGFANSLITNVTGKIDDLTGIEAFVNVTNLQLGYGALSSIDISNNVLLEELFLGDNQLESIDVSNNTVLKRFGVMRNPNLPTLDVSSNINLEELFIDNTLITTLDVSKNINLWKIYARWGNLTGLDLSKNTNLSDVRVRGSSNLTYLNIRNGNNINVTGFDVRDMPDLMCITTDDIQSQLMIDYSNGKTFNSDCGFVYIPDENFEQALLDQGIDTDDALNHLISRADAEAQVGRLGVSGRQISDLTGIEAFVNITELQAGDNQLTKINVSQNTELLKLWVYYNQLKALDLSNNTKLQRVSAGGNQISSFDSSSLIDMHTLLIWQNNLTSLDLTNNVNLTWLSAQNNQLSNIDLTNNFELNRLELGTNLFTETIDLSQNNKLTYFEAYNNKFKSLDLSNNTELTFLSLPTNELTELDLYNNTKLTEVVLANNQIEKIDFSFATELFQLVIPNNKLTLLDVSNNPILTALNIDNNIQLASLDMRNENNINIEFFNTENTPNLTCINADGVTLTEISQPMLDSGKSFSTDCGDFVNIPDENFELYLLELNIDSDGFLNGKILREDAEAVGTLNLTNPNFDSSAFANQDLINVPGQISDITGIEAFVNLTTLQVTNSLIEDIDVSNLTLLEVLWLNDNVLTSINVQSNINLTTLGVMRNNISGVLNVSQNMLLETLYAYNNAITDLVIYSNVNLKDLRVNNNSLTALNVSTNLALARIDAQYNTGLNMTFPAVELLTLTSLNLSGTGINRFNATLLPSLEWLLLNDNSLTNFNAAKAANIQHLRINNNQLGSLDVSGNLALVDLQISNNQLTDLNVANGFNSNMATMNATSNLLTCITADNDDITLAPYVNWGLDLGVQLSLNCKGEPEVVLIPDENFELALGGLDTNGVNGNILLSDALLIENLDVSGANISDLTGIESFVNLIALNCSNNSIANLPLGNSKGLTQLNASLNNIATIDLSQNTALTALDISYNKLSELTISSAKVFNSLIANNNLISLINLNDLTNLVDLDISFNLMTQVDATGLDQLATVNLSDNQLIELDMRNGTNTIITNFDAKNNNLVCIGVDDDTADFLNWDKDSATLYSVTGDCLPPVVNTQNITVQLDAKGVASISAVAIDNGSYDNATPTKNLVYSVNKTTFNCSDLGVNEVELTITDLEGHSARKSAQVTVEDIIAPTAKSLRSLTYDLNDASGTVNLTPEDINDGSSDNCDIQLMTIDPATFTMPGVYEVTLTVTDAGGNEATSITEVEITDSSISSIGLSFGKLKLTVYPVPFTDVINISFSEATDLATVSVSLLYFDQSDTGINFYANGINLISDSTTNLSQASGTIYWLRVTIGKKTQTIQIIKGGTN
ncbi:protein of unknown function [Lutibacter agarilyticus]|uniref:Por secretion system C-terminal sorting domain-containing protein n=1 Tax=Lutibacter agarilyticus TaxID=1109740 RepID=A0A238VXT6_9FLAO|nr:SusF/SusE family outer membrane protein [Lutibacter agarilyticus]SNR39001.1 protein of unknown function [Lutibacter agarilyticus]